MKRDILRIAGACGFWGETTLATRQLLAEPDLDVLVYDYLAEITLSIMARARQKDPQAGYAADFVHEVMAPNLCEIAARGIRVLSNAGGMNPGACAAALREEITRQGLDLRVAVVEGDDLRDSYDVVAQGRDMMTGAAFPYRDRVVSINAYLGAGPMVAALAAGADIVITGRCVDSALTLAACCHHFGWQADQVDLLAAGSLAGHLLECGPQSTGGNFTDWQDVPDRADIGYPIAEMSADGSFILGKPVGTGGLVTPLTVGEQLLYEIGDPAAYHLPDVVCDFTQVSLHQMAPDRVAVAGARGRAPSGMLKVSTTWMDGHRAGQVLNFSGRDGRDKATAYVDMVLARVRSRLQALGWQDFDAVHTECFGGRPGRAGDGDSFEEIALTAAVRHQDPRAVSLFLKELIGAALATPPGLHFFTAGGRPKPSPVVALYSSLVPADLPQIKVLLDKEILVVPKGAAVAPELAPPSPVPQPADLQADDLISARLEDLAVARSGDKGDLANIGVMARRPEYLPWIWAALTPDAIAARFAAELAGPVERFYLPGIAAMNIVLHQSLGGGGIASLRNDSQGKSFAQRLLSLPVAIPAALYSPPEKDASR